MNIPHILSHALSHQRPEAGRNQAQDEGYTPSARGGHLRLYLFRQWLLLAIWVWLSPLAVLASKDCPGLFQKLVRQNASKSDSAYTTARQLIDCLDRPSVPAAWLDAYYYHIGYACKQQNQLDSALLFFDRISPQAAATILLDAYRETADVYYQQGQHQDFKKYTARQHALARQEQDTAQLIDALFNLGYYFKMAYQLDSAHIVYQQAKDLSLSLHDSVGYYKTQISYAGLLVLEQQPYEALKVLHETETFFKKIPNAELLGDTYFFQASIFGKVGRYEEAIGCYKRLIPLYQEDQRFDRLAKCYGNLGHLYRRMNNLEGALESYQKALAHTQAYDKNLQCGLYVSISSTYQELEVYEKAYAFLMQGEEACEQVNRALRIAEWHASIGRYYEERPGKQKTADIDSAALHLRKAIALFETLEPSKGLADALTRMAGIYRKQGAPQKAEASLLRAYELAEALADLDSKQHVVYQLAAFYRQQGDYQKADAYNVSYLELSDLQHQTELNKQLSDNLAYYHYLLEAQQDSLEHDHRLTLQRIELAEKDKILTIQSFAIALISAVVMTLFILLYTLSNRNRQLQAAREEVAVQKEKVEQHRDELSMAIQELIRTQQQLLKQERLAAIGALTQNMAHQLKNPLNFVSGATQILKEQAAGPADPAEAEMLIGIMEDGLQRMLNIVDGLDKLGTSDFHLEELDLKTLLEDAISTLQQGSAQPVAIRSELDGAYPVFSDRDCLHIILTHILKNAAEAIGPETGDIHIQVTKQPDSYRLLIRDNGRGMDAQALSKAFEPFISTKKMVSGVGLGLFKAFTLARELGGQIEIQSEVGVGTEVAILILKRAEIHTPAVWPAHSALDFTPHP